MKIVYLNDKVRLAGNEYQNTHPKLYKLMYFEFRKVKSMDWDDFDFYMKEELAKSDKSKLIKRIGKEELYEFRLPPSAKNGVLRAEFTLDGDCYTICITGIYVKNHEPKQQPKR
jgi:hypothetical protein